MLLVLKLGGTTVRYGQTNIREKISKLKHNNRLIIIVSALAEVTDLLLMGDIEKVRKIHHGMTSNQNTLKIIDSYLDEYTKPTNPKMTAKALSYGELMSMHLFSEFLGIDHICIPSTEFIRTDNNYNNATVDWQQTEELIRNKLMSEWDNCKIILTTGFIGEYNGNITTLGRGGSDYTASIIGSLVNADQIIIYSDVDGLMTSDPRTDPTATLIKHISYKDAMEMSKKGAKVLYHRTIEPIINTNIPLLIRNAFNDKAGTIIHDE